MSREWDGRSTATIVGTHKYGLFSADVDGQSSENGRGQRNPQKSAAKE